VRHGSGDAAKRGAARALRRRLTCANDAPFSAVGKTPHTPRTEEALALALKLGGAPGNMGSDAFLQGKLRELSFALQQESFREPQPSRVKMLLNMAEALRDLSELAMHEEVYCSDCCVRRCGGCDLEMPRATYRRFCVEVE